ncbi:calmodulin-dependent protein kinase [Pelomyxa schiedti]|nr:calmodulin-dependent protein kinase [Pelomyxa schiedti]
MWIVLEHHSETLAQFLTHITNKTTARKLCPCTTTPWPIVHKYSRDICAALVHLFVNKTVHFDIKLDNILVSLNQEQVVLIDFGCATTIPRATTSREFEAATEFVISATGNLSHRAPEILNGMAKYRQNPDKSPTLCCDKQPSFELGCILFELAMCGKHPLPGYPVGYGPSGEVTFSFESEDLFPMKPPQFPKEFCDLVRSLLQCDPDKRMPLLEAFKVLLNIDSPSPSELLSFYSCVVPPLTNDAGTLTIKATCQILSGSSTEDCVDTLQKALNQMTVNFSAVQASLRGKTASFTPTDVEFTRAIINQKHRNTLPELVLTALWTKHISQEAERFRRLNSSLNFYEECDLEVGNIDSALGLVANALSLFESEMIKIGESQLSHIDCDYLPGLLFLVCLCQCINDHVSLHHRIPTCLLPAFSCALSSSTEEMRAHCVLVLNETTNVTSDPQHETPCHNNNKEEVVSEWTDLVSTASLKCNIHQQPQSASSTTTSSSERLWSCMYFVALWRLFCCSSSTDNNPQQGSSAAHIFVEMAPPPAVSPGSVSTGGKPTIAITCSLGSIHWGSSSIASLGICYDCGVGGVDKDIHKAVSLYRMAADAGDTRAMCNLGWCYANGDGVDKDIHKAVTLYQMAADAGDARAMSNLGVCYQNGIGVERYVNRAVTLWQRAADAGDARSMCNLAVCYQNGDGVDKDVNKAVALYQRAVDAGQARAMFDLGVCYENGDGVDKDTHKAVSLYQRAADAGHAEAICNLGVCYYKGDGVDKDINKAVSLYQRAADGGSAHAMNNLAWRYYQGTEGVDKDIDKAVGLWRRAADLGHAGAVATLRDLQAGTNNNT